MDHDLLSRKDLLDTTVAQQLDTLRQNSISSSRKREEKKGKSYLRVVILVLLFLVNPGTQTILVYICRYRLKPQSSLVDLFPFMLPITSLVDMVPKLSWEFQAMMTRTYSLLKSMISSII